MSIITRNKATGTPATLDVGELGARTDGTYKLFLGTTSNGVIQLLGAPVEQGSAVNETLRYNDTLNTWESTTLLQVTASEVQVHSDLIIQDTNFLTFGTSEAVSVRYDDISDFCVTVPDAATFTVEDAGDLRFQSRVDGDFEIEGTTFHNGGAEFNKGFTRFEELTQAAYDALTPDADTIYFING